MLPNLLRNNFVVTIGSHGSIVALYKKGELKKSIEIEQLDDVSKEEIKTLFSTNKHKHIYLLVDVLEQSYRVKSYPGFTRSDLKQVINRELRSGPEENEMFSYITINNNKKTKQNDWECLLVSLSKSEKVKEWADLILSTQNYFAGIYMLPIETFSLYKLLKTNISTKAKSINKRTDLCCFVVQNKISGMRHIVFCENSILFTRIVSYDFNDREFTSKYEQDIVSTFEYLKRIRPDLVLIDLDIVNILPKPALEKINLSKNHELSLVGYTPYEAALQIGYPGLVREDEEYCDTLISRCFSIGKKKLRFSTKQIDRSNISFSIVSYLKIAQMFICALCAVAAFLIITLQINYKRVIHETEKQEKSLASEIINSEQGVAKISQRISQLGINITIDDLMDVGRFMDSLGTAKGMFISSYIKMHFAKNLGVALDGFSYNIESFDTKNPALLQKIKIVGSAKIQNPSGSPDTLVKAASDFESSLKSSFPGMSVNFPSIVKSIDYTQKYHNFPVDFSISR